MRLVLTHPALPQKRLIYMALVLGLALFSIAPLYAQTGRAVENTEILQKASNYYENGLFLETTELLNPHLASFSPGQKIEAYRLLAKTYIAVDSPDKAEKAVREILEIRPSFQPGVLDPPLFIRLVETVREGSSVVLITSVSKKSENILETPANVLLLTAAEIRRRGYLDLEALLHDLPGFDIARGNGLQYANIAQRGYRTNGTDRTLFLIDGVEENNLFTSNAFISRQYALSNIERVEVIYGPASTMYGANAFTGVINVITKEPENILASGKKFGALSQVNWGQMNTRYLDLTVAGAYQEIHFSVTGRTYKSDEMDQSGYPGWDYKVRDEDFYVDKLTVTGARARELDEKYPDNSLFAVERDASGTAIRIEPTLQAAQQAREFDRQAYGESLPFLNQTDDWVVHAKIKMVNLTIGFQRWRRDEGAIGWYKDESFPTSQQDFAWVPRHNQFYLKYDRTINDQLTFSSFTRYKLHDQDRETQIVRFWGYASGRSDLESLLENSAQAWVGDYYYHISRQLRSEFKTVYEPSPTFNLVSGLEFRTSNIQGDWLRSSQPFPTETAGEAKTAGLPKPSNHFDSRDIGLYSQASYKPIKPIKLTLGLRVDNNKIRASGGYGTVFNSRAAAVAMPGRWIAKMIFSQAFKDADNRTKYAISPGVRDLANPTLEPEGVDNFEVGIGRQIGERIFADVAVYIALYDGAFGEVKVATNDPDLPDSTLQNQSIGSLRIGGVQANLSFKSPSYSAYANYTYTNPYNMESRGREEDKLRISDIASHQLNLGANAVLRERLNLNLRMNYVGERKTGRENTTPSGSPLKQIDSYLIFNGAISYRDIFAQNATLQLMVNNIFDAEYFHPGVRSATSIYRHPQNARNAMLRLLADF